MGTPDKAKTTSRRPRNKNRTGNVATAPERKEGGWFDRGGLGEGTWVKTDSLWKNLFFVFLNIPLTLLVFVLHVTALFVIHFLEQYGKDEEEGESDVDYSDTLSGGSYETPMRQY